jgi:Ca-activated chloride channel family protein
MEFLAPSMLWLLLTLPLLILIYVLALRRRKKDAVRFGSLLLMKQALRRAPNWRRHIPPLLFLLALAALMVALARPQMLVNLPARDGTVILLMDVSGSMKATDINPSRLDASKAAARAFMEKQPAGVRVGIVSFSDNASIVQPPTTNRDEVLRSINLLRPQRATAIGVGLLTALDAIFADDAEESMMAAYQYPHQQQSPGRGSSPPGVPTLTKPVLPTMTPVPEGTYVPAIIILLTDGENNQYPPPLDIIDQIENRGVRIYTVGLGTPGGAVITNQGQSMRTRLDEATLEKAADLTGGEYYKASSAQDLHSIYENLGMQLVMRSERQEITWGFAAIAMNLFLIAGALSLLWFNRVL